MEKKTEKRKKKERKVQDISVWTRKESKWGENLYLDFQLEITP